MTPILIQIEPYDEVADERVIVRIASGTDADTYRLGGNKWQPKIAVRPSLSIELMSPNLSGSVQEGQCRFSMAMNGLQDTNGNSVYRSRYKWTGAPVTVYACPNLLIPAAPSFKGLVNRPNLDVDNGVMTIDAAVSSEFLDGPLLTLEFNGDNAAGGEPDARGLLRPAGFGFCENIPPVWFDTGRWIGQIDGYGNTVSIDRLMEGLDDRGAPVADYPDYASLAAAIDSQAIIPGRWGTCIAEGLVGLGAPPAPGFPITVNATFGSNRLGAIMRRILEVHNGVTVGDIDTVAFTALDAAVDYPARFWTDTQRDVRNIIEAMAGSANATPLVGLDGRITVTRAVSSAPVATLDRSGNTSPRVTNWRALQPETPKWRIAARVAQPSSVLSYAEVLYVDDIIDTGQYDPTTVYRAGNIVWLEDGSSWLYINDTPASGLNPPDNPTHWQSLTDSKGIITTRFPEVPPGTEPLGSLYFDDFNVPHRLEEGALCFNGQPLLFGGQQLTFTGYVNIQDQSLAQQVADLLGVDDDGVIKVSEKTQTVIPNSDWLETQYNSLVTQASSLGLTLPDLAAARTAWLTLRDSLTPAWDDTTQATRVTRTDWDAVLLAYRAEIENARAFLASPTGVTVSYPAAQVVKTDSAGLPEAGELPRTLSISVLRGNVNITTDDDTSYVITPSAGITATVDNTNGSGTKGEITITAFTDPGTIDIDVTVGGVAQPTHTLNVAEDGGVEGISFPDFETIQFSDGTTTQQIKTWRSTNTPGTHTYVNPFPTASLEPVISLLGNIGQSDESDEIYYVSSYNRFGFTVSVSGDFNTFPDVAFTVRGD